MRPFIPIIELHFSNKCTGNCVICSKAHGGDSSPLLDLETFDYIVEGLTTVDFDVIQVGGDGDSFLNPIFFDALQILREEFPDKTLTLFTNGYMLTKENSERIIGDKLLDNIETRIDSVNPVLFKQSTGLDFETVKNNLLYFMKINDFVRQHIIYFPLFLYKECVQTYLNKYPTHYAHINEAFLQNERMAVFNTFNHANSPNLFNFRVSEICLWGEREDVQPAEGQCSQLNGAFKNQIYIYPNGNIGLCPYDDGQNTFILGNVFDDSLDDVWTSDNRNNIIKDIKDGKYVGRYPCTNPVACDSFDFFRIRGYYGK